MTRQLVAWLMVGLIALMACAGVCRADEPKVNEKGSGAKPVLENGRIVFPPGSGQLKSFSSEVAKAGVPQSLRLGGRLVWDEERTARVFPAFAGRVTRILVKPGDSVKAGQPLALLASPDFGQVQAEARRAQSDLALAEKNLGRLRELHQHGVAPRKDLHVAEADYARAEAEAQRALGKLKLYGGSSDAIDQSFALKSPISGVVVERNINPGQDLRPDLQLSNSAPLFVITDPSRLWVQLDASELTLSSLKRGQTVVLRTAAWPDDAFTATVDAIADFIDPATRTVKVRGRLDNRDRKLKGEMFVTGELKVPAGAQAQIPSRALVLGGDKYYVFLEEAPGRYTRTEVKPGAAHDGWVEIKQGVQPGQKVVVNGSLFLLRMHRQLSLGVAS